MDEKSSWNPTWQVWIMLAMIVGNYARTALEGRHDGICLGDSGLHEGLVPSKRHWAIVHGLLYGLIHKAGYHGHFGAMA